MATEALMDRVADVGVEMNRIHDLDVIELIDELSQSLADRRQPAAETLAPVCGDKDDPLLEVDAGERSRRDVVRK